MAVEILNEKNLWQEMAHIPGAATDGVEDAFAGDGGGGFLSDVVRTLLTELADYPEEYRRQINALSFIQRRTNLSRSRVMSILGRAAQRWLHYGPSRVLRTIAHPLPAHF